jgi:hypothetical protein
MIRRTLLITNYGLLDREFCIQKINELIALINRLLDGDYPHVDSRSALERISKVFADDLALLESVDEADDPDVILEYCRRANINIVRLHPFLGMLIRSSNLRNAFEIYFPLKIIALDVLESNSCVVLSSEWYFSPYTYPTALQELPEFIFIGVPASECQNPLIMPLAGHELGHVVWRRRGALSDYEPSIRAAVIAEYHNNWDRFKKTFSITTGSDRLDTDLFLRRIWAQSYRIASRQLEEIFCDYIGIFLFGRAFLYSFRYLVAPSLGQYRDVNYPSVHNRARYMRHAANSFGVMGIDGFDDRSFSDKEPILSPNDKFILEMADAVTEELFPRLVDLVDRFHGKADSFATGSTAEERTRDSLRMLVPPFPVTSISALVNAAWHVRLTLSDWNILKEVQGERERTREKIRVLRDLTLKGFEVFEFSKRIQNHAS